MMKVRAVLLILGTMVGVAAAAVADPAAGGFVVSGEDAARETGAFLTTSLTRADGVYDQFDCGEGGKGCTLAPAAAGLPSRAWRLLAFTGLYISGGGAESLKRMKAEQAAVASLTSYKMVGPKEFRYPESFDEIFSLHQSFEAYRATGDTVFLAYFLAGVHKAQRYLFVSGGRPDPSSSAMLLATLARQLAFAASLVTDERAKPLIRKEFELSSNDTLTAWQENLLKQAAKEIAVATDVARKAAKEVEQPGDATPQYVSPRYDGCFIVWARSALFDATHDQSQLDAVKGFFSSGQISAKDAEPQTLVNIQLVLPCVHTLIERKADDQRYENLARELLENSLQWHWDAERRPLCTGKGGILAISSLGFTDQGLPIDRCLGNMLNTGDAAWTTFLLSRLPTTHFTVPPAPPLATPTPVYDPTEAERKSQSPLKQPSPDQGSPTPTP